MHARRLCVRAWGVMSGEEREASSSSTSLFSLSTLPSSYLLLKMAAGLTLSIENLSTADDVTASTTEEKVEWVGGGRGGGGASAADGRSCVWRCCRAACARSVLLNVGQERLRCLPFSPPPLLADTKPLPLPFFFTPSPPPAPCRRFHMTLLDTSLPCFCLYVAMRSLCYICWIAAWPNPKRPWLRASFQCRSVCLDAVTLT